MGTELVKLGFIQMKQESLASMAPSGTELSDQEENAAKCSMCEALFYLLTK